MSADGFRLEAEPRLLRAALDASRLLLVAVDSGGTMVDVNGAVERAFGVPREAFLGPLWDLAVAPTERSLLRGAFEPFRPETLPAGLLFHLRVGVASRCQSRPPRPAS